MVDTKEQEVAARRAARENFRGWLEWYMRTYPHRCPTRQALADKLGITGGRVTQFFHKDNRTDPSLRFLMAASRLLGQPIDVLLKPPPPGPEDEGRAKK